VLRETGTREEPGTLTQGGALFSLVPLVWESNPKLQGGWCKANHQPIGGSDPNHQGIWSPPRAGLGPGRNPALFSLLVPLVWESNPKLQACCFYYLHTIITAVPITKLFAGGGGGGNSGGHVLRETTSRGLCGLLCPSRTSERGGEGDCVKGGGGEKGERERERAREVRLHYSLGYSG
jgi:hypothetical protein